MSEWIEDTGYWSDGAPSWFLSDGEFYARIRQEETPRCAECGLTKDEVHGGHAYLDYGSYWWRVHNLDHSHVDSGTAPSFEGAKHQVAQRINWTRFPKSDWQYEVANDDTKLGYDEWLVHRVEAEFGGLAAAQLDPRKDSA